MCGVVEFWASKGRHNPRGGSKGHDENSFFFEIVLLQRSVWRRWRFGVKEAEEVEVNGVSFCLFGEGFNICPCGRSLLAGIKHWVYATAR